MTIRAAHDGKKFRRDHRRRTSSNSLSSFSARRSQEYCGAASSAARASRVGQRRIAEQPPQRIRQIVRVPGRDEQRIDAVVQDLANRRQIRGDDRTACRHVLEQLQRRREPGRDRRCGVRQRQHARTAQQLGHSCRFNHAGERDAIADVELPRQRLQPSEVGLFGVPTHDQAACVRHERERFEEDVDPLPGVQVPRVGNDRLRTPGVELHVGSRRDSRRRRGRRPDDRDRPSRAVRSAASAAVIVTYPSAPCHTRASRRARRRSFRGVGRGRVRDEAGKRRRDLGRVAVRLVHDWRAHAARKADEQ